MKVKMTMMLAVILGIGQAFAQEKVDRAKQMTDRLDQTVTLSEEQKKQVYDINKNHIETRQAFKKEQREMSQDEMRILRDEHQQQIAGLLTEEQKTKLELARTEQKASHKAMHEEMRNYRKEHIAPVMLEKRKAFELHLSTEEKTTLSEARTALKDSRKSIQETSEKSDQKGKDGYRGKSHMHNEEAKAIIDQKVAPIAEKHKAELEKMNKDLEIQRTEWENDMQAIKATHAPEQKANSEKKEHRKRKGEKHKKSESNRSDIRFLLMDPNKK